MGDPQSVALFLQLGVAGLILYAFLTDKLRTKAQVDQERAQHDAHDLRVQALYEQAIKDRDQRLIEERRRGDEWKQLALGTERRLDRVTPVVAAAAAGVPSSPAAPTEAPGT